ALWAARDLPAIAAPPLAVDQAPGPAVALPAMGLSEHVVADYQTQRLSLKAHPMAFFRRSLAAQGYRAAAELFDLADGATARMAGLVLVRQRPGSAKGVCFVTLEDETGVANLVVWPKVLERFRKVVMAARLIAADGRIQRDPRSGVIHLVASDLQDRSDVLLRLAEGGIAPPLSRADEIVRPIPSRPPEPARAHPRDARIIPRSRDFH
ncbi:MAG: OB-fold nucleic acid binding domain-containing protein, partial [Rubrimonas sp.]